MKLLVIWAAIALLSLSALTDARAKPDDDSSSEEMGWFNKEETTAAPNKTQVPAGVAPSVPVSMAASVPAQNATNNTEHNHHNHQDPMPTPKETQTIHGLLLENQPVGFNQTCGNTENSPQCDRSKNLVCSPMKKCTCDPNEKAIYIKAIGSCSKISAATSSFSCEHDEQCREGTFGPYSQCNSETRRCECVSDFANKPVIRHNDKCFIQKRIGDYCTDNEVCDASIEGKTDCIPNPPIDNGTIIVEPVPVNNTRCNCAYDHVFLNNTSSAKDECAPRGTSESSECKSDIQCQAGLGNLSRCFGRKCQCADVYNKFTVIFFKNYCYRKLNLNDVCTSDIECQAGISDDAVCVFHESYLPNEKTCQCPEGKTCEKRSGDGAAGLLVSVTLVLLGAVATRVVT
ncbi:unnamed protein product [Allacma fusca]|uniref:Uncharacterized protein n=1 Tax=Allacma fusca TaxID=39272 RepID=A0A8J2LM22_9HEXA|nr:unnamed protein product [Allacma fusca]